MTARTAGATVADEGLAQLRAALEAALRAGHNTAKIRADIEAVEARERTRQAAEGRAAEGAARQLAAEKAASIATAATALCRPIVARINAQLAALEPPP